MLRKIIIRPPSIYCYTRSLTSWSTKNEDYYQWIKPKNIEFDEDQKKSLFQYKLSEDKLNELKKKGYNDDQIKEVAINYVNFSLLNENDDGYGMPAMHPEEIFKLCMQKNVKLYVID